MTIRSQAEIRSPFFGNILAIIAEPILPVCRALMKEERPPVAKGRIRGTVTDL